MEKISRREFMDVLQGGESVFIGVTTKSATPEDAEKSLGELELNFEGMERRTVVKRNTTGVKFSNDSWLKFDQAGSYGCYRLKNGCLMQWYEDRFNDRLHTQALIYRMVA